MSERERPKPRRRKPATYVDQFVERYKAASPEILEIVWAEMIAFAELSGEDPDELFLRAKRRRAGRS